LGSTVPFHLEKGAACPAASRLFMKKLKLAALSFAAVLFLSVCSRVSVSDAQSAGENSFQEGPFQENIAEENPARENSTFASAAQAPEFSVAYPPFNTLFFAGGKGYEFRNYDSDKLLIVVGSPSWMSVLGTVKDGNRSVDRLFPLYERYNIFVPERNNRVPGRNYVNVQSEREMEVLPNILINLYEVVSEYLENNSFESIVIFGHSEGGFIVPMLYHKLADFNISALILSGSGGLSYFEGRQILLDKLLSGEMPYPLMEEDHRAGWQAMYEFHLRTFAQEPFPDSTETASVHGAIATYRWHASISRLRPFDYIQNINIPVLFVHGEWDLHVPVESTIYIEKNLPHKPFDFVYYEEMLHFPWGQEELQRWREPIFEWLLRIDP
jgi:pimeloyl-ACP methyl ester carboxylesterase